MDHLFSSYVRVEQLNLVVDNETGRSESVWEPATSEDPAEQELLTALKCRLDLNFVRPGKDIAPAPVAGRAPDRIGVLFTYGYAPLKAGQRVVAIPDPSYPTKPMPVEGTFEIRVIPDKALDYATAHHIEVQILETNQSLELFAPDEDDEVLP